MNKLISCQICFSPSLGKRNVASQNPHGWPKNPHGWPRDPPNPTDGWGWEERMKKQEQDTKHWPQILS